MLSLATFTAKCAVRNTDRLFAHVSAVTGPAFPVILINIPLGTLIF
jgi:hypothetical protein